MGITTTYDDSFKVRTLTPYFKSANSISSPVEIASSDFITLVTDDKDLILVILPSVGETIKVTTYDTVDPILSEGYVEIATSETLEIPLRDVKSVTITNTGASTLSKFNFMFLR